VIAGAAKRPGELPSRQPGTADAAAANPEGTVIELALLRHPGHDFRSVAIFF
jgi:hypothetical protein